MNFADIENAWRSPHNRPTTAEQEEIKMNFTADLRRRHRGFAVWITMVLAALSYISVRFIYFVVAGEPSGNGFDLRREWSALVFFALPWIAAILFTREFRRHRARHPDYERTIVESLRASLDEIRLSVRRLKAISALLAVMALLMPLIVFQLRAVGKAGDEVLLPAFVIFPLFVLLELGAFAFYYRRKVQPRKRQIEALLESYE
jgi:hypothetical protein